MSELPEWFGAGRSHVWLPYTQMKTAPPPLAVVRTDGCRIVLADTATLPEGLSADGREVSGLAMADPGCSGALAEAALWTLDADRARLTLIGMGGEPVAELGAMPGGGWSGRVEALGVIRLEKLQDRD